MRNESDDETSTVTNKDIFSSSDDDKSSEETDDASNEGESSEETNDSDEDVELLSSFCVKSVEHKGQKRKLLLAEDGTVYKVKRSKLENIVEAGKYI